MISIMCTCCVEYFGKCRKFTEYLHDIIQQEDIDFGENDFVDAFQQGTTRTIQMFETMVRQPSARQRPSFMIGLLMTVISLRC